MRARQTHGCGMYMKPVLVKTLLCHWLLFQRRDYAVGSQQPPRRGSWLGGVSVAAMIANERGTQGSIPFGGCHSRWGAGMGGWHDGSEKHRVQAGAPSGATANGLLSLQTPVVVTAVGGTAYSVCFNVPDELTCVNARLDRPSQLTWPAPNTSLAWMVAPKASGRVCLTYRVSQCALLLRGTPQQQGCKLCMARDLRADQADRPRRPPPGVCILCICHHLPAPFMGGAVTQRVVRAAAGRRTPGGTAAGRASAPSAGPPWQSWHVHQPAPPVLPDLQVGGHGAGHAPSGGGCGGRTRRHCRRQRGLHQLHRRRPRPGGGESSGL